MATNKGLIVGFDIENYSASDNESQQLDKRNELESLLKKTFFSKFLNNKDTGDGIFIFIDSSDILNCVNELKHLREIADSDNSLTIRFRAVLHFGSYSTTKALLNPETKDYVGTGLIETARFLDSKCLKDLLKENHDTRFVFGISNEVHSIVIDEENLEDYTQYYCKVKQFSDYLWLYTKNHSVLPEEEKILNDMLLDMKLKESFERELVKSDFIHKIDGKQSDLSTFYVPLDCSPMTNKNEIEIMSSEVVVNDFIKSPSNIVFSGEEQSGKTTLCKHFFRVLFDSHVYLPIFISFKENDIGKFSNILSKKFHDEYDNMELYENCIKVVFLDNFDLNKTKYQDEYIDFLKNNKNFYFIITVDSLYLNAIKNQNRLEGFQIFTLRECGHKVRNQIIDKWIDFTEKDDKNYQKKDELSQFLTNTFIKGIIPFSPIYILTVLQAKDSYTDENITSKGHCYQALVYCALRKTEIPDSKIGTYITILCNLAFKFYSGQRTGISYEEFEEFFLQLSEKFNISFEFEEFSQKIAEASIFDNSSGNFEFSAPYLYYYFVAKYIAEKINRGDPEVEKLYMDIYSNLQDKANAYIAIFLIHHTKNRKVLNFIINQTKNLYSDYDETTLEKNKLEHIDLFTKNLFDKLIISSQAESFENRQKNDEEQDKENLVTVENEDVQILMNMNKALRTTEVLGQIIKNTQGEIEKSDIEYAYFELEKVYMRICNMFLTEFQKQEPEFLKFISQRIQETSTKVIDRKELSMITYKTMGSFYFMSIYASIKRTANCLGSAELTKIAKKVAYDNACPFSLCSYYQTVLWYEKRVPLDDMKKEFQNFSPVMQQLCRVLLVEYADFHSIDGKHKQQIAQAFDIPIKKLYLDGTK